jgi:hypothetical protein
MVMFKAMAAQAAPDLFFCAHALDVFWNKKFNKTPLDN